jgi:sugar phosphate isomerase/epimerase
VAIPSQFLWPVRMFPMERIINRRRFLRTSGALSTVAGLSVMGEARLLAAETTEGAPNAAKLGWRLGCQAYTFNRFTFFEAVDKVASLGLHFIEAYPGQKLSGGNPDARIDDGMSATARLELRQKLAQAKVKLVSYGVVGLSRDLAATRRVFEFAKDMEIETIVSEPAPDAMEVVDRLCSEFDINVAIHNHPQPSRYWNPAAVLAACKNRSKRIGACVDTGNWMRSGLKPVEAIKRLEGRILSVHLRDLNRYGSGAHDVPWGEGEGNLKAFLAEFHRQGFKGVFSVEYEHNWLNSLAEIRGCIAYFNRVAGELA